MISDILHNALVVDEYLTNPVTARAYEDPDLRRKIEIVKAVMRELLVELEHRCTSSSDTPALQAAPLRHAPGLSPDGRTSSATAPNLPKTRGAYAPVSLPWVFANIFLVTSRISRPSRCSRDISNEVVDIR